jgi:hypothetical protein
MSHKKESQLELEEKDDYVPYVPIRQRKEAQYERIASRYNQRLPAATAQTDTRDRLQTTRDHKQRADSDEASEEDTTVGPRSNVNLVEQAVELRKQQMELGIYRVFTDSLTSLRLISFFTNKQDWRRLKRKNY